MKVKKKKLPEREKIRNANRTGLLIS